MAIGAISIKKIAESTENIDSINWLILNELILMEFEDTDEDSGDENEFNIETNGNNPIDTDLSQNGFSRDLLNQLKDQCIETFGKIETLINTKGSLKEISSLGHFLKGSSSALGLPRIAYYCELIQNIALRKELGKALKVEGANTIASFSEEELVNELHDDLIYPFLKESLDCAQYEFRSTLGKLNVYYKNTLQ